MAETDGQSLAQQDQAQTLALPPPSADDYNNIFHRLMSRCNPDSDPNGHILSCVAYALYKQEKRAWIIGEKSKGRTIDDSVLKMYAPTWTDERIDSLFSHANVKIERFAERVFEQIKDQLIDDIYRGQFRAIDDRVESLEAIITAAKDEVMTKVQSDTKTRWITPISQGVIGNFFWTIIIIVVLASVYIGFDLSNFRERMAAFMNPPKAPPNVVQPN